MIAQFLVTLAICFCLATAKTVHDIYRERKVMDNGKRLSKVDLIQFPNKDGVEGTNERYFIEKDTGRQMFFHGVNAIVKGFPYVPSTSSFDVDISLSEEDHAFLSDLGVNVYRLGTMWPGAEPKFGEYNSTYFQQLTGITNAAAKYGIYSLLDMHQDVLSEKFCGEGVPDFAAISTDSTNFPIPLEDTPYTDVANDGYPTRSDCNKHNWPSYYQTKAAASAFQNLYTNETIVAAWGRFWQQVGKEFSASSNAAVLGYELINEPYAGDIFVKPSLLIPGQADKHNLQPVYDTLTDYIRQVDKDSLVFFAAVTWDDIVPVGFEHAPGTPTDSNAAAKSVFAYHYYEPPQYKLPVYFQQREKDAQRLGTGMFLSEFERSTDRSDDFTTDPFIDVANMADKHLVSWTMWEYKTFCQETNESLSSNSQAAAYGSCKTGYGSLLYFDREGNINAAAAAKLARSYAQKVAGKTLKMSFDILSKDFELIYEINTTILQPTEIFLSTTYNYINGYEIETIPKVKVLTKVISTNIIGVYANPVDMPENGSKVIVRIRAK